MITLLQAKQHLRIEADETDEDELVESLIEAAVLNLEHITGRVIQQREIIHTLDGFPGCIEVPATPLDSVTIIQYLDPQGVQQTLADFRVDRRPVFPLIFPAFGSEWPATSEQPESVTVTLQAGYNTIPADLQRAALLIVGHLFENREASVIGTISSVLPMAVEYLVQPYIVQRSLG